MRLNLPIYVTFFRRGIDQKITKSKIVIVNSKDGIKNLKMTKKDYDVIIIIFGIFVNTIVSTLEHPFPLGVYFFFSSI